MCRLYLYVDYKSNLILLNGISIAMMLDVISEVEDPRVERAIVRVRCLEVVFTLDDRVNLEGEPADRVCAQSEPRG